MMTGLVSVIDESGSREILARLPDAPAGLGWLPDGRLAVVLMGGRKLVALHDGEIEDVLDLSDVHWAGYNEMLIDAAGRAYIGSYPSLPAGTTKEGLIEALAVSKSSELILIDLITGAVPVVLPGVLARPNGMVISDEGSVLVVAETVGQKLTQFNIAENGMLTDREVWAELDFYPDGLCMDAEGCIWVASPITSRGCHRIERGGRLLESIWQAGSSSTYACALGGDDRRTLFLMEGAQPPPDASDRSGRISAVRVDVPGVGMP